MQTVIVNKFVIGMMAIFVMLGMNNLMFENGNINVKIYRYDDNMFYGELIVKNKKLPLIINVDGDNDSNNSEKTYNENKNYHEDKKHNINNNYNKKEEKHNENIKITDDKTPGSIEIIIQNESGQKIVINRNIGSREMSEIDKEICRKSIDATIDFISSIKGNTKKNIKNSVVEKVKGFKDYISREKSGRWFKW